MKLKLPPLLIFLCVAVGITGTAFYVTGRALASPFQPGSPGQWGAWAWAAALWAFPVGRMLFFRHAQVSRLQSLAFFMLGLGATLFMLLLLLELAGMLLGLGGYQFSPWAPWALLGLSALLGLTGWQEAMGPTQVKKVTVPIAGLARDLEGLRIVQVSDFHVSHLQGRDRVLAMVEQVMELKPDLIALTGDMVDGPLADLGDDVEPLSRLRAPMGVHYVIGNHEYFWGAKAWLLRFRQMGMDVLENEHRLERRGNAIVLILGVNDPTAGRSGEGGPDLEAAQRGAPAADFTLFLGHQPSLWPLAEKAHADLFLTGHTHGGQFWPFPPIVSLFHRYFRGLYRHDDKLWVFVHSGSGFWGPPNRLGVPPEVVEITLTRG